MVKILTNPDNAFGADDSTGIGSHSDQFQVVSTHKQSGAVAIAVGDAVACLWDSTTRTVRVEAWDTDAAGQGVQGGFGVALDAAAANSGDWVRVVIEGFCLVNIGAGSAAKDQAGVGSTTKGVLTAVTPADATVAGTMLGRFLGAEEGTSNLAPFWVHRQ